jgi:AmmeMemoRadiSam system protein B
MPAKRASSGPRPPAAAGTFYPRSAKALEREVADLLGGARTLPQAGLRGLIAPHAGYVYSGPVAAEAFASAGGLKEGISRAVVVGPAHFIPFRGLAAPAHASFLMPFGEVPVDTAAVAALADAGLAVIDDAPHAPEHAIEVELPFLHNICGAVPIVPLLFGTTTAAAVAAAIVMLWTEGTLLVVSSDLSHYEPYETARAHDERTARAIETFNEAAIAADDACGHLAVRGALLAAKQRGLTVGRLDLRNSGDTAGEKRSVVGYGAWALLDPAAQR